MKAVNLVIAILVAVGVAGTAYYLASAQTAALERTVQDLEDELGQTKIKLGLAEKKLEEAQSGSLLQGQVDELSENLWAKVDDLNRKDAELEAKMEKLASRPVPVAVGPRVAGNPDDPDDGDLEPEEKMARDVMKGVGRMITRGIGDFAGRQMDRYKEKLNLTESQSQDMQKVLSDSMKKFGEKMRKRLEGGGDGEDFDPRTAWEDFTKERDDALKDILTAEQFEQFKEMEKNQGMRWGGMRRFGGGGRGGSDQGGDR